MRKEILDKLKRLKALSKAKDVYVIEFEGERITVSSGKSSWASIGAAKNALRTNLHMGHWRERLAELKKMEEEGIIKYIKL